MRILSIWRCKYGWLGVGWLSVDLDLEQVGSLVPDIDVSERLEVDQEFFD